MLLFFTGWNTHCVVSLFVSFDTMNSLTACFFYLVYDKYINRVGRKYNIIFFDSEWILFSCVVQLHFSGKILHLISSMEVRVKMHISVN